MPIAELALPLFAEVIEAVKQPGSAIKNLTSPQNGKIRKSASPRPLVHPAYHRNHEVVICLSGSMKIVGILTSHTLRKGDAVIIKPGTWHYESYQSSRSTYHACWLMEGIDRIHWNFSRYGKNASQLLLSGGFAKIDSGSFWEELWKEVTQKRLHWQSKAQAKLVDLLADLDRHQLSRINSGQEPDPDSLIKLLRIAKTRFREPLQIKTLAREVGMSPDYLSRRFHALYGTTFKNHLNTIRIHHAQHLLKAGLPIKQVAEECGFSDVYYFSRVFKAYSQTTPGRFAASS